MRFHGSDGSGFPNAGPLLSNTWHTCRPSKPVAPVTCGSMILNPNAPTFLRATQDASAPSDHRG
eukprot:15474220-Alexandrium_andersonii.AAC.1